MNHSVPQTAATTFAFSSAFILLVCVSSSLNRAESLLPEYQVRKAKFFYIALFIILLVGWSAVLLGEYILTWSYY